MQTIEIHPFILILGALCIIVMLGIFVGVILFMRDAKFKGTFEPRDYDEGDWPETLKKIKRDFKKGKL
ncbi:MAG: hypothetical protein JJE55_08140 [Flavobacteriaceae bacterium]|nr:hypothetical protein [Flavobacteriaceae bacterium]